MPAPMFAEAEGAGGESSLEDDALAVAVEVHVEAADQPGSRWPEHRKPELLDVRGLSVVAVSLLESSPAASQTKVRCRSLVGGNRGHQNSDRVSPLVGGVRAACGVTHLFPYRYQREFASAATGNAERLAAFGLSRRRSLPPVRSPLRMR